ncbi:fibrous sheath-interacting protein 1-like isoform X2 [Mya arenaria]|uniref:fibrous sheath-interacting protein 1-like isoform X2 n=1 Tax=Mya arenaria TaxID=6604 RepID=UPI0022DF47BB|nr:fibrous sheath-interacting protein 1-like isoform X2 [Mya arenaria]
MMDKGSKKKKDLINLSTSSKRSSPASSASYNGRGSSKATSASRRSLESVDNSLDTGSGQNAGEVLAAVRGYDIRAHLQQLLTFSEDESSSDEYSLESYGDADDRDDELRKLALEGPEEGHVRTPQPTGSQHSNSLVPIHDGEELDSEEENELMKEIRAEIVNNVRQEMKSELELYQHKLRKLEQGASGESTGETNTGAAGSSESKVPTSDLDQLDPKLKAAIIKMRKLDKILAKKVKREREVKRERILLERRLRREIEEIHKEKKDEYKEVTNNEQKFLALELPPRHNEGVTVPDEFTGEEVFATQLNEDDYPGLGARNRSRKVHSRSTNKTNMGGESVGTGSDGEEGSRGDASSVSGSTSGSHRGKKKKKDFIKRNKELAADANNLIAMTDEEKKRLDDLLTDVENLPDIAENMELDDSNPFQIAVKPGDGFVPDEDELRSLTSIDSRLKELLPPEDYASVVSSSMSHVPQTKLFTHTGVKHDIDWQSRGERALFRNAEQRQMNERLQDIEIELSKLKNPDDLEIAETPVLNEDQLHELLEQCVTSLSHTSMSRLTLQSESRTSFADTESIVSHSMDGSEITVDSTPRSPRSARQDLLDNPPRLAPEVLQKLLSEAYHPLSKQLSTLKEEDNEDVTETPIPSEVWKLISMETVDESKTTQESLDTDTDTLVSVSQSLADTENSYDVNNSEQLFNSQERVNGQAKSVISARNGFRSQSRASSASSLASVSDLGRESRNEKEPLKLPEIDPSGTLVTQGQRLNNGKRNGNGNSNFSVRTPVSFVRNSLSDSKIESIDGADSRLELMSLDGEIMSPHPPVDDRRKGSGNKSRTTTPASSRSYNTNNT